MPTPDELDELALTAVTQAGEQAPFLDDDLHSRHLQMVVIGMQTLATHPLPDNGMVTIGRSDRCEVPIDDKSISRRHAILSIGDIVTIEDLGSANGTRVRGAKVKLGHPVAVSVGELIGLGKVSIILQHRAWPLRSRKLWTHDDFQVRVTEECARAQRFNAAFALLHVHTERRAQASTIEEVLGELVRESDILGKHGASDYQVLLSHTMPTQADEAFRRIQTALIERGIKCRLSLVCCPRDGKDPRALHEKLLGAPTASDKSASVGTGIIVTDEQMQGLHMMVQKIAASQIGVLLLGETGVGKEVFARAVHQASPRASGPFVDVNCAALTETLLESELFGHEKGAFTNATGAKPGLIEMADGGTIFLDEVGDMPLATQVKLLRVIEDSQLRRVGGLKSRSINVRFIAATNSDLEAQIAMGTFRRDLYFRLNGVTIVIPPLRERLTELEPLARAFIARAVSGSGEPAPSISPEALELMMAYPWPGNIRELKHMMERAVLLCGHGPIAIEHLPAEKMRPSAAAPRPGVRGTLAPNSEPGPAAFTPMHAPPKGSDEERQWIIGALEKAQGNQTVAARLLGISRRTLVNRLNEYDQVYRPRKGRKPPQET